jgi:hypothetical protein
MAEGDAPVTVDATATSPADWAQLKPLLEALPVKLRLLEP